MTIYQPIVPESVLAEVLHVLAGVRVGNLVFLSGTTATDDKGRIVGVGDIVAQTRQIFRKFAAVLASVGGSLANIVETTDYVLSLEDYAKTAARPSRAVQGAAMAGSHRRRGERPGSRRTL